MIRVVVEIDDVAFGKVWVGPSRRVRQEAGPDKPIDPREITLPEMTPEEVVELLLAKDTDLDQFSAIYEVLKPGRRPGDWEVFASNEVVKDTAIRMNHPQSRPHYGTRRR